MQKEPRGVKKFILIPLVSRLEMKINFVTANKVVLPGLSNSGPVAMN